MSDRSVVQVTTKHTFYDISLSAVKKIIYHQPAGEGDRHYCDVTLDDGAVIRHFDVTSVMLSEDNIDSKR